MCHGVPIVASRAGAIPEVLDEGRCGVLIDPASAPERVRSAVAESGGRVLGETCHFFDYFCFLFDSEPVQRQLRIAFANDANFLKMGDQQRQELAEGYILDFLVEHAALNAAVQQRDVDTLNRLAAAAVVLMVLSAGTTAYLLRGDAANPSATVATPAAHSTVAA